MKQFQTPKQSGFTLIELIVVMVILGILAATALPRFIDLGGDARSASMAGARGSLVSTQALLRGRWLATPVAGNVTAEGVTVPMDANGYPTATEALLTAAGITSSDYTIVPPKSTATANAPGTGDDEVAFYPNSVKGTPRGLTCSIKYKAATTGATAAPPSVSATPTADKC